MSDGQRGVRRGLEQTQLPYLEFLGGETLSAPDNTALTIPRTTSCIEIDAEDGPCYWNIGGVATVNAPGYIPTDGSRWLGPLVYANLQTQGVRVYAPAGIVHVTYWREN